MTLIITFLFFLFFENTKYFNTHEERRESFKEIDSSVY